MSWYFEVLKKYAVLDGRARRKEYWMFVLTSWLVLFALVFVSAAAGMTNVDGNSPLVLLYQLGVLVPSTAVGVRRMHDVGHSGWWLLVPVVNLLFAVSDSETNSNRYGPNPKNLSP